MDPSKNAAVASETPAEQGHHLPWWKRVKQRLVKICDLSKLSPGQHIRFSDGRVYQKTQNGNLLRISPRKPWNNRAERREVLKARRAARNVEPEYGTYGEE